MVRNEDNGSAVSQPSGVSQPKGAVRLWWLALVALGAVGGVMHLLGQPADANAAPRSGAVSLRGAGPHGAVMHGAGSGNAGFGKARHHGRTQGALAAPAGADRVEPQPASLAGTSLRGTEVDGRLRSDADGNLIVEPEVLQLFDYFLTLEGELSEQDILARIEAEIARRLGEPAAGQARALLRRYRAYRDDGRSLAAVPRELTAAQRIDAVHDLRVEHFGEQDAASLFEAQEQRAHRAAEQARVALDPELSEQERAAELAMLDAERPAAEQQSRQQARVALQQRDEEAALRAGGAGDVELHAQRVATVGPEAADRLAALDARRRAWRERVEAFTAERDRLSAAVSEPAQLQQQIEALTQQRFSTREQIRLRVWLRQHP